MIAIYLSGTGNTKHCVEKLTSAINPTAEMIPLERADAAEKLKEAREILLAYPTQFSNCPYVVRDFINKNQALWQGKQVFCMTTMGAFSGDGAGCSARLLKKYGAKVLGGLQVRMPDAVCDNKMLKKSIEDNKKRVREADAKLERVAIIQVPEFSAGMLDLQSIMQILQEREIRSVLVEGGSKMLGAFKDAGLVDRVYAFVAPKICGGQNSLSSIGGEGVEFMDEALQLENLEIEKLGNDVLLTAKVRDAICFN